MRRVTGTHLELMLATGATNACLVAGRRAVLRAVRVVRAENMVVMVVGKGCCAISKSLADIKGTGADGRAETNERKGFVQKERPDAMFAVASNMMSSRAHPPQMAIAAGRFRKLPSSSPRTASTLHLGSLLFILWCMAQELTNCLRSLVRKRMFSVHVLQFHTK